MGFPKSPLRVSPAPERGRVHVFAVGGRAYVSCPPDGPQHAALTDDAGRGVQGTLRDGAEVAIVAWRPASTGTRYKVRAQATGVEGWLGVAHLRTTADAPPPVAAADRPA